MLLRAVNGITSRCKLSRLRVVKEITSRFEQSCVRAVREVNSLRTESLQGCKVDVVSVTLTFS
jgi:hypothetical protein